MYHIDFVVSHDIQSGRAGGEIQFEIFVEEMFIASPSLILFINYQHPICTVESIKNVTIYCSYFWG